MRRRWQSRRWCLPIIFLPAFISAACGARLMKLPSGPGAPAPDTKQVITEATRSCSASSITAEVAVRGSVGGRRLRARLLVGLMAPASARIEAFAASQQIFIMVAQENDATLLLTTDNRVLEHGRPGEILEAVAGVPLDAADLRTTLLGCPNRAVLPAPPANATSEQGRQIGDWRIVSNAASELYFRREPPHTSWRLVTAVRRDSGRPEWRTEYRDFAGDLPRSIRLVGGDGRFDLRLALSQVELNVKLPSNAFTVNVPARSDPITLEELRRDGLLPGE
jgi:hypothetical protein